MTTTRITVDGKRIVIICNSYTQATVEELEKNMKNGLIHRRDFYSAELNYNCAEGCPVATIESTIDDPKNYPLKFTGFYTDVWCSAVTAGYNGEGPRGSLKCLEMMGFNLSETEKEHLFSDKEAHLTFKK